MAEQDTPSPGVDLYRVARIVGSYVQHHQIGSDQLAGLIGEVHRALASLGRAPPVQDPLMPAVPIRLSVQQDHVVCLECGTTSSLSPAPAHAGTESPCAEVEIGSVRP